jgi:2-haloacid dehalogenase
MAAASLLTSEVAAAQSRSAIEAVAFDAFAIFDPRSVFRLAEELFPGRGAQLSDEWRTRQFEYTWLHNSMHRYTDFWQVTQDALAYAARQTKVNLSPAQNSQLMSAFLQLKPWPDVAAALETLRKRGLRLAILSNMTSAMMQGCVKASSFETMFEFQLSTDRVKAFKPDPDSYNMALEAFHLQKRQIAFVAFGGWDAAGAKAFGYPTYWVNRLDVPAEELGVSADASGHDLSALPSFLDSL